MVSKKVAQVKITKNVSEKPNFQKKTELSPLFAHILPEQQTLRVVFINKIFLIPLRFFMNSFISRWYVQPYVSKISKP